MERERKKSKQSAGEGMYCRGDDQADLRKAAFGDSGRMNWQIW